MSDEGTVALTWKGADGVKTAIVTIATSGAMSVDTALDLLLDGLRLTTSPAYAVGKVTVRELRIRTREAAPPAPRQPAVAEAKAAEKVPFGARRRPKQPAPLATELIGEPLRPVGEV